MIVNCIRIILLISRNMNIKKILFLVSVLIGCVSFTGCEKDPGFSPSTLIYQQYQVFRNNNTLAAFANFRDGGANGGRYMLSGAAEVKVNNQEMYFTENISNTEPEFNYSLALSANVKTVKFTFKKSRSQKFENSVDISNLPVPEITDIVTEGDQQYAEVNLMGANFMMVNIFIVPRGATDKKKAVFVALNPDGRAYLSGMVTPGIYDLYVEYSINVPTTQNDGNAGGNINVVSRTSKGAVTIR